MLRKAGSWVPMWGGQAGQDQSQGLWDPGEEGLAGPALCWAGRGARVPAARKVWFCTQLPSVLLLFPRRVCSHVRQLISLYGSHVLLPQSKEVKLSRETWWNTPNT